MTNKKEYPKEYIQLKKDINKMPGCSQMLQTALKDLEKMEGDEEYANHVGFSTEWIEKPERGKGLYSLFYFDKSDVPGIWYIMAKNLEKYVESQCKTFTS